jgi:glycosyltransferase involved in cell wall biosynthesis/uncharacterized protein YqgV (UPF0045/DUF77 family)
MRIAVLSWESLHSIAVGGVASHVTELAAAMQRKGHSVHVFTRMAPGQKYHDIIHDVHYHRCPYPGHPDFVDDMNNMCRAMVDRVFAVEDFIGPFDVIHAHDWLTANAMIWIKQGRQRFSVLTMHATEYARCGNTFPGGRSARIRDWADRVIAVSKAAQAEILWMYEVPAWKTTTIYNGVSPHRFNQNVDAGAVKARFSIGPLDPLVLFCGRLEWQKGPDLLIEAIPSVLHAQGSAKFVFLGDGGMRGQLENRARQLGVMHAVRFLGFRDGDELVKLFKASETVCVPSRNEPFGIVVLEAWAAHKPVVVSQIGGPNEYVTHEFNGLKIFPHPSSVAWGLTTLFSNFDRARWMGHNGRRAVEERFTWEMIADQTAAVYGVQPVQAPVAVPRQKKAPAEVQQPVAAAEVPQPAEAQPVVAAAVEKPPAKRVRARLSLRPRAAGLLVGDSLAACRKALAHAGLRLWQRGMSLIVEGDLDAVSAAVRRCYEVVDGTSYIRATMSPVRPAEKRPLAVAKTPAKAEAAAPLRSLSERIAMRFPRTILGLQDEITTGALA